MMPASPRMASLRRAASGWTHLPRDARDTLFLLGVVAWVVAPHVGHLPVWCSALAGMLLAWRGTLAVRGAPLPPRWIIVSLLVAAVATAWMTHRTLLGKEAGVTLLVVLVALKTLELRARRDAFVVFFLGFFLVLTNFLYSQSLPVALTMLLAVWGLLAALVLAHMPVGQPSLARAAGLAARMCLLGAPVMVALFLLFPRFGPLWGLPNDAAAGRTGLSGTMEMGTLAELALDDNVALTVRFLDPPPAPEAMYFRGPVLSEFDGRQWRVLPGRVMLRGLGGAEVRPQGRGVAYEVTFEPTRVPVLPLLEATPEAPALDGVPAWQRPDLTWVTPHPLMERQRARAVAYPRFQHGPVAPAAGLEAFLQLPAGYNPRLLAWSRALRGEAGHAGADPGALARALFQHIRTQGYTYTLAPGLYGDDQGRHAIDEFWFDRREGFCEHFAAAFVVAMRAMGVPARIVTGYQGAERNPVDGYYLVRNSYAHAWAEYWEEGKGWVRADPTAAVAPDRIVRHLSLRAPPGLVASALGAMNEDLVRSLRDRWAALNTAWNQWVLNYSRGRQLDLLKHMGFDSPRWEDLALLLLALVVGTSAAGAAWAAWERQRQDPWLRAYHGMRRRLAQAGLDSADHVPPGTLARLALARWGEAGVPLAECLQQMDAIRYAPPSARPAGTTAKLARMLRRKFDAAVSHLPRPPRPAEPPVR